VPVIAEATASRYRPHSQREQRIEGQPAAVRTMSIGVMCSTALAMIQPAFRALALRSLPAAVDRLGV
jgi:hypothetical protein